MIDEAETHRAKGRPKKIVDNSFVLEEVKKFFDGYKSIRAGAIALGVSSTSAWAWYHGKFKPSKFFLEKMTKLGGNRISEDLMLSSEGLLKKDYKTLFLFILEHHIKHKANILNIPSEQYYKDYVHPKIKEVIEKQNLSDAELPMIRAFFDGSLEYWVKVAKLFGKK